MENLSLTTTHGRLCQGSPMLWQALPRYMFDQSIFFWTLRTLWKQQSCLVTQLLKSFFFQAIVTANAHPAICGVEFIQVCWVMPTILVSYNYKQMPIQTEESRFDTHTHTLVLCF